MRLLRNLLSTFWIPLVLLGLVLLFMLPFIRPPTGIEVLDGHDLVNQQYPLFSLIFDSVRDGKGLPLWNPYQFSGQSIVSNPQSSVFYLPAWIMVLTGVPRGVGWLAILHLWLGGWGMAMFLRRLQASPAGALIGGIIYTFSAFTAAHLNGSTLNYLMCWAWLPWMAAAYLWSVKQANWQPTVLGGGVVGMAILSGHPPMFYFGLVWLTVLWLYLSLTREVKPHNGLRALLTMLIVGAVLGAALWLPVADFTLRSNRTGAASLGFSNSYALPPGQALTLLFPNLFGEPVNGYWGVPFYEELTIYIGVLPLVALFLSRRRPVTYLLASFVVIGLIVSMGIDGGLFSILYSLLPGYQLFRVPSRALYFVEVGGAGLAALWITELQNASRWERIQLLRPALRRGLPIVIMLCISAAFLLMAFFNAFSTDPNPPWRLFHTANVVALTGVFAILAWVVLRVWTLDWASMKWSLLLTGLVILIDLWRIAAPLVTVSAVDVPDMWKAMSRVAPSSPDFRVMTVPDKVVWQAGLTYTQHLNANGYDPLVSDAYQRLLNTSDYNPTSSIARLLGVRYVISDKPFQWSGLSGIESLTLKSQDDGWYIYEAAKALPRTFVAPIFQVMTDDETARQTLASSDVSTLPTIVSQAPDCTTSASGDAEMLDTSHIVDYRPNSIDILTTSVQPGVLVLTDSYDPNWSVTVDSAPASLLRVDTALRGVCVPAGDHQVRFVYQPKTFVVGVMMSLVGWGIFIVFGLFALWNPLRSKHLSDNDSATSNVHGHAIAS
jgi:hypothetical protein